MASDQSQRGVFLLTIGQWKEAEPLLLEAATSSPNYWELSSNLGALYTRLNLPEAAAFAYRTVLMLNPENELAKIKTAENWNRFVSTTKVTP
jgi:Flp pilus assembly protein TadD